MYFGDWIKVLVKLNLVALLLLVQAVYVGIRAYVLLEGKLNEYLHDIDEECHEMLDRIVEKMKEKQGVTEKLKAENQMMWVGKMNNIIACAEEVVVREVVYV